MRSFDYLRYELKILGRRAILLPLLILGVFLLVAWSLHLLSRGDPARPLSLPGDHVTTRGRNPGRHAGER